jgi:hypothetical protein
MSSSINCTKAQPYNQWYITKNDERELYSMEQKQVAL